MRSSTAEGGAVAAPGALLPGGCGGRAARSLHRRSSSIGGARGGLALGLITFYYLRGQFNFIWTVLQLTINAGLTVGEFLGVSYLLKDTGIAEISYGYVLIFISVPTLISINKQLLDSLTKKLNVEKRVKQPIQIL